MARKRNYQRYELKQGQKVVYRGITNDPVRREEEHRDEGKRFSHLHVVGRPVTKDGAEAWEEESLKSYREGHGGKNPRYNDTDK